MTKILLFLTAFLMLSGTIRANDCHYWQGKADPKIKEVNSEIDEEKPENIIAGIECLLKLEGIKRRGTQYGQKSFVSQMVPDASVEINALYQISEMFYGNDDFAYAVALIGDPPKRYGEYDKLLFNSKEDVKKAFRSYRSWFSKIKIIGIEQARMQKLDPLANSGVRWYGP
jgi:hypothetical protein